MTFVNLKIISNIMVISQGARDTKIQIRTKQSKLQLVSLSNTKKS